jgi:hypothetical protein
MGIEKLNSAARAAGFAMAPPEDPLDDVSGPTDPATALVKAAGVKAAGAPWRPGRAILVRHAARDRTDWLSVLLGLLRRAPA